MTDPAPPPPVDSDLLSPYAAFLILQCLGSDLRASFALMLDFMRRHRRRQANAAWTIVANGLGDIDGFLRDRAPDSADLDDLDGFVYQRQSFPSWSKHESAFIEIHYELAVALRRFDLIAVHCDSVLREAILRWLDKEPKPPLRRVPSEILQGAFLTGEAKGLWLRGTHVRRTTKADSKNLSGRKLQDALNPFEDSSFAMSTARATLPADPSRTALIGNIGTTPRRSLVWSRPTADFPAFVAMAIEALSLVAETIISGAGLSRPYPLLATESHDLSQVYGAYDLVTLTTEELLGIDASDDLRAAADLLEGATLSVRRGYTDSANFLLDVGMNGSSSGSLSGSVTPNGDGVRFSIGIDNESQQTNLPAVIEIRDALQYSNELLTVYYDSGHMVDGRSMWSRDVQPNRFPQWKFRDFTGFNICKEKPDGSTTNEIHVAIGTEKDDSLFNWVVENYCVGWLTCDDGSGEVADFIHVAQDGVVSLIHVKGANSRGQQRRIAVGCYEVVASQAAKNFVNLDRSSLRSRLTTQTGLTRAAWTDGVRVNGRAEFVDAFDSCSQRDPFAVTIIQPHVSESTYNKIRNSPGNSSNGGDLYRLNLLETLLNTIRGSVTSLGAEMDVIASSS